MSNLTRREFTKTTVLATTGFLMGCQARNRFDVILRNGTIVDGTGTAGRLVDIGIRGELIEVIDNLSKASGDIEIDASGMAVVPGFIDIHTHTDTQLLVNGRAESKIMQGVTTEIGGNCGSSVFPLTEEDLKKFDQSLYERYEIHAGWQSLDGFLSRLEQQKISINYATLTGHGDLRSYVVGKNDVAPTADQLEEMQRRLLVSMQQGSFGMSTGLEYAPGSYAETEELIALCRTVAGQKGLYATHMRNEDDTVEEAVDEALRTAGESGVSLQISHLKACNRNNWHKIDGILEKLDRAVKEGLPVLADRYPYTAYGTGLSTFLPLWARQGSTDEIIARLEDPDTAAEIRPYTESRGERIGGWDRYLISYVFSEENKRFEGKSIAECIEISGLEPFEFVRRILIEERMRAGIVGFAMDEDNLKKVLSSPHVMVASDGSAVAPYGKLKRGKPHPRFYGTFPRAIGRYCREQMCFDFPTAVRKMSAMPADKLGLDRRGYIRKGYFADLVVLDPETVIDRATFTDPHRTPAGIPYVLVNGKVVVDQGKHTGILSGRILRA